MFHIYFYLYNDFMIPVVGKEYQLVLAGDSSVGKSSLLCQFVDGIFKEALTTIGVEFKYRRVKIGNDEVRLQIRDTAGQQTYKSIANAYYNSADAILLVYDISSYQSFESIKDYWLHEAQNNNKTSAKIFIFGNKLDAKREVESYSLDALKEAGGIHAFFQVSAKQNINVQKCFIEVAKVLHTSKPPTKKTDKLGVGVGAELKKVNLQPKASVEDEEVPKKKGCC